MWRGGRSGSINEMEEGKTPLYIACKKGHVDAARLLLDNGAEVDRAAGTVDAVVRRLR